MTNGPAAPNRLGAPVAGIWPHEVTAETKQFWPGLLAAHFASSDLSRVERLRRRSDHSVFGEGSQIASGMLDSVKSFRHCWNPQEIPKNARARAKDCFTQWRSRRGECHYWSAGLQKRMERPLVTVLQRRPRRSWRSSNKGRKECRRCRGRSKKAKIHGHLCQGEGKAMVIDGNCT